MLASLLTQGHHAYSMCTDIIFQILLPHFRPMTSHHVTSLSHAFFIVLKKNKNKNKNKNKIKRKIDKRKNKMLGLKCSITILALYGELSLLACLIVRISCYREYLYISIFRLLLSFRILYHMII